MKPSSTVLCLSLLVAATPAFAQTQIGGQLYLNYTDCTPTARNKDLNCTSTTSSTIICATAKPAVDVAGVLADLGWIDVIVGSDPLTQPAWWQFQTNGCSGASKIVFSCDFSANTTCTDVWLGLCGTGGQWGGTGGPFPDGYKARVKWTTNVTPDLAFPITAGTEAYIEKITLRQSAEATCPGCATPACAVYLSEQLYIFAGGYEEITSTGQNGTEWLTFNDAANAQNCPGLVPTRNQTWGQVKSLYR